MIRLTPSSCAILSVFLLTSTPSIQAAEIAKYDEGPFAGMGYPYSECARVGNLLFLAGQAGEDADGKLVPGGIKAEAEQLMLNIEAALARRGLAMNTWSSAQCSWPTSLNGVLSMKSTKSTSQSPTRPEVPWAPMVYGPTRGWRWNASPDSLIRQSDLSDRFGPKAEELQSPEAEVR